MFQKNWTGQGHGQFVWSTETTKFPCRYTSSAKQGCKITPGRLVPANRGFISKNWAKGGGPFWVQRLAVTRPSKKSDGVSPPLADDLKIAQRFIAGLGGPSRSPWSGQLKRLEDLMIIIQPSASRTTTPCPPIPSSELPGYQSFVRLADW